MEDLFEAKLQLQTLQHEVEFLKQIRNVEVARREHLETQLCKTRHELDQCKVETAELQGKLTQSQQQVQELESSLYNQQVFVKEEEQEQYPQPLESDLDSDDELDIEILKIKSQSSLVVSNAITVASSSTFSKRNPSDRPDFDNQADASKDASRRTIYNVVEMDSLCKQTRGRSTGKNRKPDPDECPFCGKRPGRRYLVSHIQKRHRDPESSRWICTLCQKQYFNRGILKCHYDAVHCNIRYSCDLCKALFKYLSNAKAHRKKHFQ